MPHYIEDLEGQARNRLLDMLTGGGEGGAGTGGGIPPPTGAATNAPRGPKARHGHNQGIPATTKDDVKALKAKFDANRAQEPQDFQSRLASAVITMPQGQFAVPNEALHQTPMGALGDLGLMKPINGDVPWAINRDKLSPKDQEQLDALIRQRAIARSGQ